MYQRGQVLQSCLSIIEEAAVVLHRTARRISWHVRPVSRTRSFCFNRMSSSDGATCWIMPVNEPFRPVCPKFKGKPREHLCAGILPVRMSLWRLGIPVSSPSMEKPSIFDRGQRRIVLLRCLYTPHPGKGVGLAVLLRRRPPDNMG